MGKLKVFSVFSGIGGFELGLLNSDYDFEFVGYSEIDKWAISIYEKNFKGIKNYGDATRIQTEELPDFDLLFEVNVLSWIIQNNNQKFHPYQLLFQF
jgi:DNA (cytosine-5)-methyltransferase 1